MESYEKYDVNHTTLFNLCWDYSDNLFLILSETFLIKAINPSVEKIMGWKLSDIVGKHINDIFKENALPLLIIDKDHINKTTIFLDNQYQQLQITWQSIPIFGSKNQINQIFLIGKITSINEYLEIFQLNNVIKFSPGFLYWKNKESVYQGCNDEFARLAGLNSRDDVKGKTDFDLIWKDRADLYIEIDKAVIKSGESRLNHVENITISNGKMITAITNKVPMKDHNGEVVGILGITTDITEQKKIEEELRVAKEAAETANQAKSNFIANMSHDIRTPLTGVIGLSEMLESTLEKPDQKENAHLLYEAGEELLNMLNDILDDVRADNLNEDDLQEESFDLYGCLEDLVKLELPTTKVKNLELKLDIAADVPQFIISDRKKIQRILLNLVGNAIKFTQSGHIVIEVTCLNSKKSSVHLQFGVADTGIGIPKELQQQVFERFFRVTSSFTGLYQGHGLGLHIAQSYVSLLGGHITLTSDEGVGSTFYFDLSCKLAHKAPLKKQKKLSSKLTAVVPRLNQILIKSQPFTNDNSPYLLLVEDNLTALKILENLCVKNQCRFASAKNGEDALELAKSNTFDLIITDVGLPDISGIELTQAFRDYEKFNVHSSTPIIGLTAHALAEAEATCIDAGMNMVFPKPMKPDMMELIIDVFLKSKFPLKKYSSPQQQAHARLGIDLPSTEDELFLLNNFPLLDIEEGIKCLGSDNLLNKLLNQMAQQDIPADLQDMQYAFDTHDWKKIEQIAHKIKGGAVYCGTIRLKLACQYLERYYKAGYQTQLPALYSQLITIAKETIEAINQWGSL